MSNFEPKYLSASDLATRLNVSRQTISYYIKVGKIKAIKAGRSYRISIDEAKRIERGGIL